MCSRQTHHHRKGLCRTGACRLPGITTPNKEQRTHLDFSFSPPWSVFFFFFNLLRKQESTFVTFESSVVHFGPDPVPRKWRGHVPVSKELEVQPGKQMCNQSHTSGVKRVKVGRVCCSVWEIRECFLEEMMYKLDLFLPPWPLEGKTSAKRGLRPMIRYRPHKSPLKLRKFIYSLLTRHMK